MKTSENDTDTAAVTVEVEVRDEGLTLRLALAMSGRRLAFADMTAAQTSELLELLAVGRASLADQIPTELEPNPRLGAVFHPAWWKFEPQGARRVVALRHPGFGWIAFVLTPDQAAEMAEHLTKET